MLHIENEQVRSSLLEGNFGLEKESLRITPDGRMAQTRNPFPNNPRIVRDFCENQTEINTTVVASAQEALAELYAHTLTIERTLAALPEPEMLWPFSNPVFIKNEADIPVAQFTGEDAAKTAYREYLSDRYGRYKMTLCGIHVNYSFGEKLLRADFLESGMSDFQEYKNQLYLHLAQRCAAYGWIVTAITAASPLMDASFVEKGVTGKTTFNGMASTRCSELGYWNAFAPLFDYTNIRTYARSIERFVDDGLLAAPSELYFPIRLKPRGQNTLQKLHDEGVDHIELRMVDLNPLVPEGMDLRDLQFIQLFLVWLASTPAEVFTLKDQVQAVQNFKNAAHYDLKTVKIMLPTGRVCSLSAGARDVIDRMRVFYQDYPEDIQSVLAFEDAKFADANNRYAWQIREAYREHFLERGLQLAALRQKEALQHV